MSNGDLSAVGWVLQPGDSDVGIGLVSMIFSWHSSRKRV